MKAVGIRELKDRLSEYLQMVRRGEDILVTDRGQVVAELRRPCRAEREVAHPRLLALASQGHARVGAPNSAELYPPLDRVLPDGSAAALLERERDET